MELTPLDPDKFLDFLDKWKIRNSSSITAETSSRLQKLQHMVSTNKFLLTDVSEKKLSPKSKRQAKRSEKRRRKKLK
jgi:hypothetical protein